MTWDRRAGLPCEAANAVKPFRKFIIITGTYGTGNNGTHTRARQYPRQEVFAPQGSGHPEMIIPQCRTSTQKQSGTSIAMGSMLESTPFFVNVYAWQVCFCKVADRGDFSTTACLWSCCGRPRIRTTPGRHSVGRCFPKEVHSAPKAPLYR